jgi:hypothetical protein
MCRSIRTLFNFEPPATDDEIRAASLQFVRKLSGFNAPSKANEAVFRRSVEDVFRAARRLVDSLVTRAPARDRVVEGARASARAARRFGRPGPGGGRSQAAASSMMRTRTASTSSATPRSSGFG